MVVRRKRGCIHRTVWVLSLAGTQHVKGGWWDLRRQSPDHGKFSTSLHFPGPLEVEVFLEITSFLPILHMDR